MVMDAVELDLLRELMASRRRREAIYNHQLWSNRDCRDPDHPGCPACSEDDDEENQQSGVDEV